MSKIVKVSRTQRIHAIDQLIKRKGRASGANDHQIRAASVIASQCYCHGETAHRAIKAGIASCERFISWGITNPTAVDCVSNVVFSIDRFSGATK